MSLLGFFETTVVPASLVRLQGDLYLVGHLVEVVEVPILVLLCKMVVYASDSSVLVPWRFSQYMIVGVAESSPLCPHFFLVGRDPHITIFWKVR